MQWWSSEWAAGSSMKVHIVIKIKPWIVKETLLLLSFLEGSGTKFFLYLSIIINLIVLIL